MAELLSTRLYPVVSLLPRMDGSRMRRRLAKFLPIVMIALVVQIFAPIAACWATAITASDPLSAAAICHSSGAATHQQGDQGIPQHEHGAACSLCCLAGAGANVDTPQAVTFAIPYREAAPVAWYNGASDGVTSRASANAQARAPPFSS